MSSLLERGGSGEPSPSGTVMGPLANRGRRWLAYGVVAGLLVGTMAAFAITERLKLTPSPIFGTRVSKVFSPVCGCDTSSASVRFRLRRGGSLEADVIDGGGAMVLQLARRRFRRGVVLVRWAGRDQAGRLSADGLYRIRVHLVSEHRTIVFPNLIRLDTVAPKIELFRVSRRMIRVGERTRISYRFDESAHAILLVDGTQAVYGRFAHSSGTLDWFGKVAALPVRAGPHRLTLEARDDAGNVSAQTTAISVRVRTVAGSLRRARHVHRKH